MHRQFSIRMESGLVSCLLELWFARMPTGTESDHVLARRSLDTIEFSLQQFVVRSDNSL
jgi:hypothetical protein